MTTDCVTRSHPDTARSSRPVGVGARDRQRLTDRRPSRASCRNRLLPAGACGHRTLPSPPDHLGSVTGAGLEPHARRFSHTGLAH